jgi:hypothetical protein
MVDKQLYYNFEKQMQNIKTQLNMTDQDLRKDTQRLNQQVSSILYLLELRNREMQKKLKELQEALLIISRNNL